MGDKFNEQILLGKIYSETNHYEKKLQFAKDGIKKMLDAAPNSYISLSFGKQSNCLAHLIYQINPKIPCFFLASDETWYIYDYENVIEKFTKLCNIDLTIVQTKNLWNSASWKESRDVGDKDLENMCDRDKWQGWFWGLSKDESKTRRRTCSIENTNIHPSIYRYKDNKLRCTPIMNWTIKDLAAYIYLHNIPLLNIYYKYGLEARTTARITKKMLNANGVGYLRATNSRGFRKIANKFDIIRSNG